MPKKNNESVCFKILKRIKKIRKDANLKISRSYMKKQKIENENYALLGKISFRKLKKRTKKMEMRKKKTKGCLFIFVNRVLTKHNLEICKSSVTLCFLKKKIHFICFLFIQQRAKMIKIGNNMFTHTCWHSKSQFTSQNVNNTK